MMNKLTRVLTLAGFIVLASGLIWVFSLHGTGGLVHVNGFFRMIFLILICISALILISALISWLNVRKTAFSRTWFSLPSAVLALIGLILGMALIIFVSDAGFSGQNSATEPRLLLTSQRGSYGLPDLAVTFQSRVPNRNALFWGTKENQHVTRESANKINHAFMLRNLKPATEYWYRINSGAIQYFTTPDLEHDVLTFAVGGDAHFGAESSRNEITQKILQNIAKPENHINFFFSLGDLVEYGFRKEQWIEALNSLSAVSSIPIGFAVGNHDAMFDGINNFTRYCLPDEPHPWYRIDAGKVHFLILDIEWSAETFSVEQQNWLEDQLKNIPAGDWKIVLGHGFYYASGSVVDGWCWYDNPETINRLSPIFEKYRVNLVFSGHNHQLELLHRNGVNYIICGGMGGILDPERSYQSPASLWYACQKYGFVTVELFQDQAKVTFRNPDYTAIQNFNISLSGQTPSMGK